jgi:hypothetical protein
MPRPASAHLYELIAKVRDRQISWTFRHASTAHKRFAETVATGRTIDTNQPCSHAELRRDGALVKSAMIGERAPVEEGKATWPPPCAAS